MIRRLAAAVLAAVTVVAGCSDSTTAGQAQQTVTPIKLDPAALHYGAAVAPKPGVTLQPDVVIVEGGGAAVRAVTDGGLTWTLDPAATGVADLAVGKVMFVTGRGAGRVINVSTSGDGTVVTIAPAGITDIVRDGAFTANTPISFDDPLTYSADDAFWSEGGTTKDAGLPGSEFAAALPPTLPAPTRGGSGSVTAGGFNVTAHCCKSGAELGFTYDGGDIRLIATFALKMASPHATFDLRISGGTVTRAKLELGGALGIKVDIAGAARAFHTVDKLIPVPLDFNVPFASILGVPLSATVNQIFAVHTYFSSKDGNIKATGEWNVDGALGFSYENGAFRVSAPTSITKKIAVLDTISGVATGGHRHRARLPDPRHRRHRRIRLHGRALLHLRDAPVPRARLSARLAHRRVQPGRPVAMDQLRRRLHDPETRRRPRQLLPREVRQPADREVRRHRPGHPGQLPQGRLPTRLRLLPQAEVANAHTLKHAGFRGGWARRHHNKIDVTDLVAKP